LGNWKLKINSGPNGWLQMIKLRRMRWVGHRARILESRNAYTVVGKPEGKRPVDRLL
jgi:hypothetical protein